MNEIDLKNIAAKAKENYVIDNPTKENVEVVNEIPVTKTAPPTPVLIDDDDEPTIFLGPNKAAPVKPAALEALTTEEIGESNDKFKITDADLKAVLPDLDELTYKTTAQELRGSIEGIRRKLIVNQGFTIEEADTFARNRLTNKGKEINDDYLTKNPKIGIIEINKTNEPDLQLTTEERSKLSRVRSIRLIAVEDMELATVEIEKVEKKIKANYLKTVEGSLSRYPIPIPILGDYITFKGAQIIQLIGTVHNEDESMDETISKKASLIYDRMYHSSVLQKYGENNTIVLSYTDFANQFKFHDLDIAMFGILVASSMEEVESPFECSQCNSPFQWKYNLKSLLKLANMPDKFKEITNEILRNKNDMDALTKIHMAANKVLRFKSPFTQNIYDIAHPSVARAIAIFQSIDQKDTPMLYLSPLGMFIQSMRVYNASTGKHIHIEDDEIKTLMETLQEVPQIDLDLLFRQINDMIYLPEFELKTQCPVCGNKMTNPFTIDQLVFLKAQDTSMEIK